VPLAVVVVVVPVAAVVEGVDTAVDDISSEKNIGSD
jgi:hypothetical protein